MNALTPILTPYALENIELLQRLDEQHLPLTQTELARALDRDLSNLRRTLGKLADEGYTALDDDKRPVITEAGRQAVSAVARMSDDSIALGQAAVPPPGFAALTADDIEFDPHNARTHSGLSEAEIDEMAESIREHGVLEPPMVRFEMADDGLVHRSQAYLVDGERRLRGWRRAIERGWLNEDTRYLCPIFDGDDIAATEAALVKNLQRVDLDNLEAAEGLRKLSDKSDPPATAATIARRLGKEERWVEQRLKVAREASEANKDRYRAFLRRQREEDFVLAADPDPFRWTDLRNSVQKPKHLTALEKNPRLAMLVVEMAVRGEEEDGIWDAVILLPLRPWPDIFDQADSLGLITRLSNAEGFAYSAELTPLACEWLASQSFGEEFDRPGLVAAVRSTALGPIAAAALAPGQYGTDFLNLSPEPDAAPTETPASPTLRPGYTGDAFSLQLRALARDEGEPGAASPDPANAGEATPDPTTGDHPPQVAGQAPDATPPVSGADPNPPPPAGGEAHAPNDQAQPGGGGEAQAGPLDALSPLARLALLELAHAISTRGVTARGGGLRGAAIYDFHNHQGGTWGDLFRAKLAYPTQGQTGWIGVLTDAAVEAVRAQVGGVTHEHLAALRLEIGGVSPPYLGAYASPWLNPPKPPEPGSEGPAPSPAPSGEGGAPSATDEGSASAAQQPTGDIIVGGMRRALVQLHAEAARAQDLLRDIEGHKDREGQVLSVDLWPRLTGVLAGLSVGLADAALYLPKEQG